MKNAKQLVKRFFVVDENNNVYEGEDLLRTGYSCPWPNELWEPNELFATTYSPRRVCLVYHSTLWEAGRCTRIETDVCFRSWERQSNRWKEITDGDHTD